MQEKKKNNEEGRNTTSQRMKTRTRIKSYKVSVVYYLGAVKWLGAKGGLNGRVHLKKKKGFQTNLMQDVPLASSCMFQQRKKAGKRSKSLRTIIFFASLTGSHRI